MCCRVSSFLIHNILTKTKCRLSTQQFINHIVYICTYVIYYRIYVYERVLCVGLNIIAYLTTYHPDSSC